MAKYLNTLKELIGLLKLKHSFIVSANDKLRADGKDLTTSMSTKSDKDDYLIVCNLKE